MALPATDTFTDVDGTTLTTHNANWSLNVGDFAINSNNIRSAGISYCMAHWNADTFNDDQYAKLTVVAVNTNQYLGASVRVIGTAVNTGYLMLWAGTSAYMYKVVSGTFTQLGSAGTTAVGVVDEIRAVGSTISHYKDGTLDTTIGEQTDSGIAAGSAGIFGWHDNTVTTGDLWEGGNLGSSGISCNLNITLNNITISSQGSIQTNSTLNSTLSELSISSNVGIQLNSQFNETLYLINVAGQVAISLKSSLNQTLPNITTNLNAEASNQCSFSNTIGNVLMSGITQNIIRINNSQIWNNIDISNSANILDNGNSNIVFNNLAINATGVSTGNIYCNANISFGNLSINSDCRIQIIILSNNTLNNIIMGANGKTSEISYGSCNLTIDNLILENFGNLYVTSQSSPLINNLFALTDANVGILSNLNDTINNINIFGTGNSSFELFGQLNSTLYNLLLNGTGIIIIPGQYHNQYKIELIVLERDIALENLDRYIGLSNIERTITTTVR